MEISQTKNLEEIKKFPPNYKIWEMKKHVPQMRNIQGNKNGVGVGEELFSLLNINLRIKNQ